MIRKTVRHILAFLKKWFWTEPTSKDKPLKATDVIGKYICFKYKGQWINLRKSELTAFNRMGRKDKRAMGLRFKSMQKKGQIMFREINGKMVCLKNKDYEAQLN